MRNLILFILSIFLVGSACNSIDKQGGTETDIIPEAEEITLTKMDDSPKFPEAKLNRMEQAIKDPDPADNTYQVAFDFEVSNYELKQQTTDAANKGIANSDKGQHIHAIFNNGPYHAKYTPDFTVNLEEGHYVGVAFLSRSYHESVKASTACQFWDFTVGNAEPKDIDLTKPHLFYSRPKGTYTGEDTEKVLLDFYLANVLLTEDGYHVRATINGKAFTLTDWAPYLIEGLPMGESTIKLELLDRNSELVDSPFNPVERTITLKPAKAS